MSDPGVSQSKALAVRPCLTHISWRVVRSIDGRCLGRGSLAPLGREDHAACDHQGLNLARPEMWLGQGFTTLGFGVSSPLGLNGATLACGRMFVNVP